MPEEKRKELLKAAARKKADDIANSGAIYDPVYKEFSPALCAAMIETALIAFVEHDRMTRDN